MKGKKDFVRCKCTYRNCYKEQVALKYSFTIKLGSRASREKSGIAIPKTYNRNTKAKVSATMP